MTEISGQTDRQIFFIAILRTFHWTATPSFVSLGTFYFLPEESDINCLPFFFLLAQLNWVKQEKNVSMLDTRFIGLMNYVEWLLGKNCIECISMKVKKKIKFACYSIRC